MCAHHALPGAGVAVLEGEALGVWAVAQNGGIEAGADRTEHIASHHGAVVHGHTHIPLNAHAIARLQAAFLHGTRARRGAWPRTARGSHLILPHAPTPDEQLGMPA